MKKLTALFLTLIILLSSVAVIDIDCIAAETSYTDGYYTYTIISAARRTASITKYSGSEETVNIPSMLSDKYTVTELAASSFASKAVKVINIPACVESINSHAFSCDFLSSINVDEGNKYYKSIDGVLYSKDMKTIVRFPLACGLETFTIPDGVEKIGDYAFYGPYNSSNAPDYFNLEIPEGVTEIGYGAFHGAYVNELRLPESVTTIGERAFLNAKAKYLYIGANVTELGEDVFCVCSGTTYSPLKTIEVSEENEIFSSKENVLFGNYGRDLIFYPRTKKNKDYVVPDGVKTIKSCAFAYLSMNWLDLNQVERLESDALFNVSINRYIIPETLNTFTTTETNTSFEIVSFNHECRISFHRFSWSNYNVKLYGYTGSTAESFVNEKASEQLDLTFIPIDGIDKDSLRPARTVFFGEYPQRRVSSRVLSEKLSALDLEWKAYPYYSGSDKIGSQEKSDYMKYTDVTYNGHRYRGVTFSQYRPVRCYLSPTEMYSYQDDNGYYKDNIYWFKYEPIEWTVLDKAEGLAVTKNIIDCQSLSDIMYLHSQQYYNDEACSQYANDYCSGSLRHWLNNDFCLTAFTNEEMGKINTTRLVCNDDDIFDKVFLLSGNDVTSTEYGYTESTDSTRLRYSVGSDYAQSQGLQVKSDTYYDNNGCWLLRSGGASSDVIYSVTADGKVTFNHSAAGYDGIRPVIRLSTISGNRVDDVCEHKKTRLLGYADSSCSSDGYSGDTVCTSCGATLEYGSVIPIKEHTISVKERLEPTCTDKGKITYICRDYGEESYEELEMLEHTIIIKERLEPTCTDKGKITYMCRDCGEESYEELEMLEHTIIVKERLEPTCTDKGKITYMCRDCGEESGYDELDMLEHTPTADNGYEPTCTTEGLTDGSHCSGCGKVIEPQTPIAAKGHIVAVDNAVAPTFSSTGLTQGSHCVVCNAIITKQSIVPAVICKHTSTTVVIHSVATEARDGSTEVLCSICGASLGKDTTRRIGNVAISRTRLTYTGKTLTKPVITVTDIDGNVIDKTCYSVKYVSRSTGKGVGKLKKIGQYKVLVTLKGKYSGTRELYFTVNPRKGKIKRLSSSSRSITAGWKRDKSVSGYQLVIAENSKFTKNKRVIKLSKNSKVSKKIKGLKKGRKYYIKVRAYKNVKVDGRKATIYGAYSKKKAIICK